MTEHSVNFLHLPAPVWVAPYGPTNNHAVMPLYQSRTGSDESIYQIRGQEDCSPAPVWPVLSGLHERIGSRMIVEPACCKIGMHYIIYITYAER